jgi:hypothetical protein
MLLQMLLGGIAGVAVSIKMFGKRIFRVLAFWKRHDEDEQPAEQRPPAPAPARRERDEEAVKEPV